MITFALDLNLIPSGVMPRISVSQYDHGQMVECDIYDGMQVFTIPNGATAYVQGTKGDSTGFQYDATIANNKIKFEITEQMSAVAGDVVTELVITHSGDRIGTINFIINVEEAALSDNTIISETDLPVIQQIPEYVEEAQGYAEEAEAWANGGEGGTPSATDNAKYWAEQAQLYAVGALHWKGNVAFANLPTSNLTVGDVYNVTDAFTTDNRFNEGTGIPCPANTNVIWGSNSKWDLQAPNAVHSFNGRVGAVVPASGDYSASQISSSAITGQTNVEGALTTLNANLTGTNITLSKVDSVVSSVSYKAYKISKLITIVANITLNATLTANTSYTLLYGLPNGISPEPFVRVSNTSNGKDVGMCRIDPSVGSIIIFPESNVASGSVLSITLSAII